MELKGKLVQVQPLVTGEGKNGTWKKQEIIIETGDQYPKKICIEVWGDKINENQLIVGNELNISADIESREYNGKWYTGVKAWKIEVAHNAASTGSQMFTGDPVQPPSDMFNDSESDNLPF
jgi:hypothetical protein